MSDDELKKSKTSLFELFFTDGKIIDILTFEYEKTLELKKLIDSSIFSLQYDLNQLKIDHENNEDYIVNYDEISMLDSLIGSCEFLNEANKSTIEELSFISDKSKSKYAKLDLIKLITIEKLGHIIDKHKHTEFQFIMANNKYDYYKNKKFIT